MAQVNLGRVVGYSAYEIAVQEGFEGTEQEWLASLKGETGNTGPAGATGDDGTTFTPSVSAEGVISWTNDGGKPNPISVNIKGPQGIQGPTGPQGPAGSYTEGTGIEIDNDEISVDTTVVALKSDLGDELPPIASGDAGKVLKVNAGETAVEWANDASQTYTGGTGIDITNNEISVDNTIATKSELFSGDYDDLTDKPDLSIYAESSSLATVATSGDYDDLTNKPTIPAALSAGTGIDITSNVVSIDNTVALKSDIPAPELPTISSGDAGKALVVNSLEDGVEWATVGGGSSYTAGDGIDITNNVISNTQRGEWAIPVRFSNAVTSVSQSWNATQLAYIENAIKFGIESYPFCLVSGLDVFRVVRWYRISNPYYIILVSNTFNNTNRSVYIKINMYFGAYDSIESNLFYPTYAVPAIASGDAGKALVVNSGETAAEWATISSPIPECPTTTDSTFELRCVVSGGVASYSWVDIVPHPILTSLSLYYNDGSSDVNVMSASNVTGTVGQGDVFSFSFQGTLSEAIDDTHPYLYSFAASLNGQNYNDNSGTMPVWDSTLGFWLLQGGPTTMRIVMENSTDLSGQVYVFYDPHWTPPVTSLETVTLVDVNSGNQVYSANNLGITDVGGIWQIANAQLASSLSDNQQLDVWYVFNNGPSMSSERVTLSAIADTPNLTTTCGPATITFFPQGSDVYNINFTIGGEN